jgi:streptogramin lyase
MMAKVPKLYALATTGPRNLALGLAILQAVSAGCRPAAAQSFTEFSIPTAKSGPFGITAGPDGALWFAENNANKIGRITVAGVVTEFPIPTANSAPSGITTGPDGALWFTENGANKIGRLRIVPTATHDFNGDGRSDLAWRDTSGNTAMWLMNGAQVSSTAGLGNIATSWSVVGQRDFNGDGWYDWLWSDADGSVAM